MSQLSFDLGGPDPIPPENPDAPNLFYALRPPVDVGAETICEAGEICHRERLRQARPQSVLHLTLSKIGHYGHSTSVIETAQRIGDGIFGKRLDVKLTRLMHFHGSGAVVLAADEIAPELAALNVDLIRELRRTGFKPPTSFKPHMTFVYEKNRLVPEALLQHPINWRAIEFELVLSPPKETRHEILGRWKLA